MTDFDYDDGYLTMYWEEKKREPIKGEYSPHLVHGNVSFVNDTTLTIGMEYSVYIDNDVLGGYVAKRCLFYKYDLENKEAHFAKYRGNRISPATITIKLDQLKIRGINLWEPPIVKDITR